MNFSGHTNAAVHWFRNVPRSTRPLSSTYEVLMLLCKSSYTSRSDTRRGDPCVARAELFCCGTAFFKGNVCFSDKSRDHTTFLIQHLCGKRALHCQSYGCLIEGAVESDGSTSNIWHMASDYIRVEIIAWMCDKKVWEKRTLFIQVSFPNLKLATDNCTF